MKTQTGKQILFAAAVLCFSLFCCLTVIISGDDYIWYYTYELPELAEFQLLNGRYLANGLTFLLIRFPAVRLLLYTLILFLCIWTLAKFVQLHKQHSAVSWLGMLLFCLMPSSMFSQIIRWMSGFGVYVMPMILMLFYLRCCFLEFTGKPVRSRILIPVFAVTAIAGALFVEHVTIYNCVLAGFVLLYAACRKDLRVRAYQIAFAAGTAIGTCIMFLNANYAGISGGDQYGDRAVSLSLENMYMQLYSLVIPRFAVQFVPLHLVIAGAFLVLYDRADRQSRIRSRYAKAARSCIVLYAVYSCFSTVFCRLEPLSPAYRVRAIECVFAFLYLISIVYLGYVLTERHRFLRIAVYCSSAFFCSAVFCIANPVNDRCFFADFCFWLLLALELFTAVLEHTSEAAVQRMGKTLGIAGGCILCFLSYISIVNRYAMNLCIRHLRTQLEQGIQKCELITLPYPDYAPAYFYDDDTAQLFQAGQEADPKQKMYWDCFVRYYDLPVDAEKFSARLISVYNYHM